MTTGMGFPPEMGIPWKSHGDGKKTPTWQLEWEGVGMNVDGNGNNSHRFFTLVDLN